MFVTNAEKVPESDEILLTGAYNAPPQGLYTVSDTGSDVQQRQDDFEMVEMLRVPGTSKLVIGGTSDQESALYDAETYAQQWLKSDFAQNNEIGYSADEDVALFYNNNDQNIYARRFSDGSTKWTLSGYEPGSNMIQPPEFSYIVMGTSGSNDPNDHPNHLVGIDPATQTEAWKVDLGDIAVIENVPGKEELWVAANGNLQRRDATDGSLIYGSSQSIVDTQPGGIVGRSDGKIATANYWSKTLAVFTDDGSSITRDWKIDTGWRPTGGVFTPVSPPPSGGTFDGRIEDSRVRSTGSFQPPGRGRGPQ
jgi:hypothetical protein